MPLVSRQTSIPGASTNDNLIAGDVFEFLPFDAHVSFGLTTDPAAAVGDLVADVFSGSDILVTGLKLPNTGPVDMSRDLYLEDDAIAGDRLVVRVRNTTAATARNANLVILIEPI